MLSFIVSFFYWLLSLIGLSKKLQSKQDEKKHTEVDKRRSIVKQQSSHSKDDEEEEEEKNSTTTLSRPSSRIKGKSRLSNRKLQTSTSTGHHHKKSISDNNDDDDDEEEEEEEDSENDHNGSGHVGLPGRRGFYNKDGDHHDDNDVDDDDDGLLDERPKTRSERINAKKTEKKQLKQQKKEYLEQLKLEKERKREEEMKREEELELKREEEERKRKEELKKKKEEEDKVKQKEYDEWRHLFEVEDSGTGMGSDLAQNESLLAEFIKHIKETKVVVLEEIAAQYKLRTESVIERIKELEADGTLTGLWDERGKFIYITNEELDSVAKFIQQRGRVTIKELAQESNHLITLTAQKNSEDVPLDELKLDD